MDNKKKLNSLNSQVPEPKDYFSNKVSKNGRGGTPAIAKVLKDTKVSGAVRGTSIRKPTIQGTNAVTSMLRNSHDIDIEFYQPLYANPISLLSNSKIGLLPSAALDFIQLSGFTHSEFQLTFKTTVKTIQNYATQQLKLDAVLSEKLLKAFALFEKGIGLFGSPQAFHDWLNQPAFGLGNQLPYSLMDTITGIMLIEEELIRLEYGDLA